MRSVLRLALTGWVTCAVVLFLCLMAAGCTGFYVSDADGTRITNEPDHVEIERIDGSGEEIWR